MLRRLWVLIFYVPLCAWAQTETRLTWLDNRFRVDPEIEQITFIVAREQPSQSVVLVAPNGHKYYADRHSKAMSWYSDQGMDIISIDHPMAGPWQALGKVSSNNGIKIVSNIELDVDPLPTQLYQTEVLKFRARLTQNKQPLLLRDFLERVQLKVAFYPVNTDVDDVTVKESASIVVGTFADNGQGYDEIGGDGIFTVALGVDVVPGKYRVKIASTNGVFERAVEQTVLVYPSLITTTFIESHQPLVSHVVKVTANDDLAAVGSLATYLRVKQPQRQPQIIQTRVQPQQSQLTLRWPNNRQVGKGWWRGWAYVTDTLTQRELVFRLAQQNYTQVAPVTVDTSSALVKRQREQQLTVEKTELLQQRLLWLGVANLIVMIGVLAWLLLWRRKRAPKSDLIIPK
ncbi:TIGR03503 family protein [Photobacterium aquimaris]|uniref:TIGR03503 family protein n=1 Tax=Photobacterium aquimaris TaxID=512643 RepID=A0A2T3IF66_9GAMM|nr:TIGR03503 family protein [Photobacterium aquimaris]OBU12056.1 TIGR03503 family protein [Photobacterium aquimaris]OBU19629.1 TIGR03503 family protein [Photobacterium aquimaris]PSU24571.1 TIGR03503 family protein [Photobacterium aquimaris]PSV97683.1 TIGR03503 family protein [Photobacterium aquimaris]